MENIKLALRKLLLIILRVDVYKNRNAYLKRFLRNFLFFLRINQGIKESSLSFVFTCFGEHPVNISNFIEFFQQPQYRQQLIGMPQMSGNGPRPQLSQQLQNAGNNQQNNFDDVPNFDFNNIM